MINTLFKIYVILIPFQVYAKFSGITVLRVLVLTILIAFIAHLAGYLKVERKAINLGIAFLSAPIVFMIFDIYVHEKSILVTIYLPLLLNIMFFVAIINFKKIIDFDAVISLLLFVCIATTILHFTICSNWG